MRICLIHISMRPTPVYGEIAFHLRSAGHEVWLTKLDSSGNVLWDNGIDQPIIQDRPRLAKVSQSDARIIRNFKSYLRFLAYIRCIRKMVLILRPDIVQLNTAGLGFTCLIRPGMPHQTKFIANYRQIGDPRIPRSTIQKMRSKLRDLTRRTAATHCFDHALFIHDGAAVKGLGPHWRKRGSVIPLGVHDSFLKVQRSKRRNEDNGARVRFIYIGSMVKHRKIEMLLSAIKEVANQRDDFRFDFLVRDKPDDYYLNLIKELQLEQFVDLIPPVSYEAVPGLLVSYDVALAYVPYEPTDWTYSPTLKVLEYRALGIPIIATDVPPNHEVVIPGHNGLLSDNKVEKYASAMLRFVEDRSFLEKTRENAEQMRDGGLSWCTIAQMQEDLFNELLAGRA